MRDQAENLFTEIEGKLKLIEDTEKFRKTLEDFDYQLRDREKKLEKREDELVVKKGQLDREREFITGEQKKLAEREALEERIKTSREKLIAERTETEQLTKDMLKAQDDLEKKVLEYQDLDRREEELKVLQALLGEKETMIGKKKEQNELDALANKRERERLQAVAESFHSQRE